MEFEKLAEKLKRDGERWNSSLKAIRRNMDELADLLADLVPSELGELEFTYAGLTWGNKILYGWPAFEVEGGFIVPRGNPGDGYYHAGDFNKWVQVANREEIREAAKVIEEWLVAFAEFVEKEAEKYAGVAIEEVLKRLRG